MPETVEFEIKKQFKNYLIIVKTMSDDREKSFYNAYSKDALVLGYVMKLKIKSALYSATCCSAEDAERPNATRSEATKYYESAALPTEPQ